MSVLLVHTKSFDKSLVSHTHAFSRFYPNPTIEDVFCGVDIFKKAEPTEIIAAGGGSAIDVAKAIKYYTQSFDMPLTAIPTTAGSGSDATCFAVIYEKGEKLSLEHENLLPNKVLFWGHLLNTLPLYIKQSSLLDAFAQAIESMWSINATEQSKICSRRAIDIITKNYSRYLFGDNTTNHDMLVAANFSGKAINITKTTAPHAMSYKLTSMFGIAHGHAVALTLPHVYRAMQEKKEFDKEIENAVSQFEELFKKMKLDVPQASDATIKTLAKGVNIQRLKNSPVPLDIEYIYRKALA
ncbi:MAG: iron-containing alcohol dehydrogenase [Defluviitaleaceae bacterium]|nr:iron-containing alcohol dehydrogenase [Defluviitaleaceae bacterium]